ncbi:DUF1801 domain-containing protein [Microbacterium suaedae]|uniref:DUF1801 domain-containing protein n=1 Tax=Microbacterium suaedae TaxID=2067813 RepID=UPI000DA229FD|nr:DUF1801 domain-containing protein [Microbacterium suaedae]
MSEIDSFLARVTPAKRRRDAETLLPLMAEVTGEDPVLTGTTIGFGSYHYRYASGREGDAAAAGFAPRKAATTIYLMDGVGAHEEDLAHLGPHKTGVGCLYIADLTECDLDALRRIVARSYRTLTSGVFGQRARESSE